MKLCLVATLGLVLVSFGSTAGAQTPAPSAPPEAAPHAEQPPAAAAWSEGPEPAKPAPEPSAPPAQPFVPPPAELLPTAPPAAPPPPSDQGPTPSDLGSYQTNWQAMAGLRSSYITHPGFDPFADNNSLVQSTIGLGRTLAHSGPYSVGAFLYWEYGARSGKARGESTSLGAHRFGLGPEIRWYLIPQIYLLGRPSLTLHTIHTQLEDTMAQATLHSRKTSLGFDLSLGAGFQLFGRRSGAGPSPRLWAIGEGGYGWSAATSERLRPDEDDVGSPARVAPVRLGPLALRGGFFKLGLALTY